MRDINSDKQAGKKQEVILRKAYQPNLFRVNRRLLTWTTVILMVVVLLSGFLVFPNQGLLQSFASRQQTKAKTEVYNVPMNPVLSAEINALKGQLIGLISGSIESKLRILEMNVRAGRVSEADLGTIQDLKNDVQVLKTYSATGAGRLIAEPYASRQVHDIEVRNHLLNEVSQLKQLLYLSIASCGLMFAAIGGVWLRQSLRLESARKAGRFLDKNG